MSRKNLTGLGILLALWLAVAGPAWAQLQPPEPDPLARMRAKAQTQSQVCTPAEPSACAAATPKIVASALGPSPLAENLRRLENMSTRVTGAGGLSQAAAWAVAGFRGAGVDDVHTEEVRGVPGTSGTSKQANVVAEIRGREKPEEFVLLGAHLDSGLPGGASENTCNAALVIEAARDIHLTGLRPLRSIRFVLFTGGQQDLSGSRVYAQAHRAELDRAIAAVIFDRGCGRVIGFSLGGRPDIEAGVREAFAVAPLDTWDVGHDTYDAPWRADNFDFLLEGVPNLLANRASPGASEKADLNTLQRNTAVAGMLAFALAEHPAPLGPRLSRNEIAAILKKTGLEAHMMATSAWREWQSGLRGRQ